MTEYAGARAALSLRKLKHRGDKAMAAIHETVAAARRVTLEAAQVRAETKRLHDRFHGPPSELSR